MLGPLLPPLSLAVCLGLLLRLALRGGGVSAVIEASGMEKMGKLWRRARVMEAWGWKVVLDWMDWIGVV